MYTFDSLNFRTLELYQYKKIMCYMYMVWQMISNYSDGEKKTTH